MQAHEVLSTNGSIDRSSLFTMIPRLVHIYNFDIKNQRNLKDSHTQSKRSVPMRLEPGSPNENHVPDVLTDTDCFVFKMMNHIEGVSANSPEDTSHEQETHEKETLRNDGQDSEMVEFEQHGSNNGKKVIQFDLKEQGGFEAKAQWSKVKLSMYVNRLVPKNIQQLSQVLSMQRVLIMKSLELIFRASLTIEIEYYQGDFEIRSISFQRMDKAGPKVQRFFKLFAEAAEESVHFIEILMMSPKTLNKIHRLCLLQQELSLLRVFKAQQFDAPERSNRKIGNVSFRDSADNHLFEVPHFANRTNTHPVRNEPEGGGLLQNLELPPLPILDSSLSKQMNLTSS